ncbi:MAG: sigma-54-dependent Fis family transcriptional regulator [Planctomycetota bacterium]|nr:MAG: sigma-54-dependent Fis family transcriptional regulator [Planctomycetota bacterium]
MTHANTATHRTPAAQSATPAAKGRILVVDDDRIVVDSLGEFLRLEGYEVHGVGGVDAALASLAERPCDLVITDVNMPQADGFELLRALHDRHPDVVAIVITGYGTIESAVEAIKMGAYDYLTKPLSDDEIRLVVQRALAQQALLRENRTLREQLDLRYSLDSVVGHDYKMLKIFDLVQTIADSRTTVLITGESGTGKSLVAHAIHHRSDRRAKPFIEVSCGAIPEGLLESELFGHVKGSFTGAVGNKDGKFKAAEGGTLFLDEINSASPALQVKLLRVLQEKKFEPVGSNQTITADVRVILASNVDLKREVEAGRFRQDLYYRVNVVTLQMPTLVERLGDIPLLAETFLRKYCAENRKQIVDISLEAMQRLQRYHWPGNVRELENAVERAVVLCKGRHILPEDLPAAVLDESGPIASGGESGGGWTPAGTPEGAWKPMSLKDALEEPERRIIEAALKANNWNRQLTAEVLQINRTTLYKKMKHFGLEYDPARHGTAR